LLKFRHLRILESTIEGAGKGVFALDKSRPHGVIIFKKNSEICKYDGHIISKSENDDRYGINHTAPYSYSIRGTGREKKVEDAACHRGVGSLINHSNQPNAHALQRHGRILIFASRDIRNGEEVFTDYGADYWGEKDESAHTTK